MNLTVQELEMRKWHIKISKKNILANM
jgi:hypothetical protein